MIASFHRAYVASDMHLGGEDGFQMFSSETPFRLFCENIAEQTSHDQRTLLLINGDFVDFLAEDGATYWNGQHASRFLQAMSTRTGLSQVFDGLHRFVGRPGARLVFVLGNHDLELAMPEVKRALVDAICRGGEASEARIEFAFDGWGYRFKVGRATALATHGNEVDSHNFTRFDILQQVIQEERLFGRSTTAETWKPSAGTAFVIDAVNKIKRRFPFVDVLKPEAVTFLCLTILAPEFIHVADEFAALVYQGKRNETNRPSSERRFLSSGAMTVAPVAHRMSAAEIEAKVNNYLHNPELNVDDLIYRFDDDLLGMPEWVVRAKEATVSLVKKGVGLVDSTGEWIADGLTKAGKKTHRTALRKAIRPLLASETFDVTRLGSADQKLAAMIRQSYDVVLAGHTHKRRFVKQIGRYHVNTGTWAGLMSFEQEDVANDKQFKQIFELLKNGSRRQLTKSPWFRNERPVAVMTSQGDRCELRLCRVGDQGQVCENDLDDEKYIAEI